MVRKGGFVFVLFRKYVSRLQLAILPCVYAPCSTFGT